MGLFEEPPPPPRDESLPAGEPSAGAEPRPYVALARKYRPRAFDEVVGQEAAVGTLKNALETGRLHHAYLFSGIRGVGKTTVARLFARALNCKEGPTVTPCGVCAACREIAAGQSLDVIEIDAASNRGVDDVEPLREAARYAPSRDRYKVFILDEVHMLSNAAFNSLLKILEEPPPRIVWILATTEHRKVPPTVVSRCQHFEFHRVPRPDVVAYLARVAASEKVEVEPAGLSVLAAAAGGSVRDAVSLLDQVIAYAGARATEADVRDAIGAIDRRLLVEFLRLAAAKDAAGLLRLIARLAEGGAEFGQFASGLVATVRDAALLRFSSAESLAGSLTEEERRELQQVAGAYSEDGLLRVFNALLDLPMALRGSPQPRFALEAAALRLVRMADLTPIETVLARLEGGAAHSPAPAAAGGAPPKGPAPPPGSPSRGAQETPARETRENPSRGTPETPAPGAPGIAAEETVPDEPPHPAENATDEDGEAWRQRFLDAAQRQKLSLRTYLEGSRSITLIDGVAEIRVGEKQSFFRDALGSEENRKLLDAAASEAAGRPVSVRVVAENGPVAPASQAAPSGMAATSGTAAAAGPADTRSRRDRLIESAMKQPAVRRVMETFKGQIVDIQEMP